MNPNQEISRSKDLEEKALAECNNEPIETPGNIQRNGALISFRFNDLSICHISKNIGDYLEVEPDTLLGKSIRDVFSRMEVHDISNIASHKTANPLR